MIPDSPHDVGAGVPGILAALLLAFLSNLFGSITHYGSGQVSPAAAFAITALKPASILCSTALCWICQLHGILIHTGQLTSRTKCTSAGRYLALPDISRKFNAVNPSLCCAGCGVHW